MTQQFINNWASSLSLPATASAVQLSVPEVDANRLTGLGTGDHYLLTLAIRDANGIEIAWEIVRVTAAAAGVLDVLRAQEGTTALELEAGAAISARLTAGTLSSVLARLHALENPEPPGTQFVLELTVGQAGEYFGWDSDDSYAGGACVPSSLDFGDPIGVAPIYLIDVSATKLSLEMNYTFTQAQLVSINAQGVGEFAGTSATFADYGGGDVLWEWDISSHDWTAAATRSITLTFAV